MKKENNNNNNNVEIRAVKSFKENIDVIWGNKKKKDYFPINNHFPEVIFVDKKINENNEEEKYFNDTNFNSTNPIDNFLKSYIKENNENFNYKNMNEDQYNQNRLLNNLANIVNNDKEDSDNDNEENQYENMNSDAVNIFEDNIANLISNEKENNSNVNQENSKNNVNENKKENLYESDFGEIEELRIDLENSLGINLFKEIYHYVDENTDENEVKCDYEKLNLKLNTELKKKNFNEKEIETAIKKIPEVFTIVGKERICNKNN